MNYKQGISPYTARTKLILKELLSVIQASCVENELFDQEVIYSLFYTLNQTSESTLILLENKAIFDADILLRCVLEGTIKLCYLLNGNKDQQKRNFDEYKLLQQNEENTEHRNIIKTRDAINKFEGENRLLFDSLFNSLKQEELEAEWRNLERKEQNKIINKWKFNNLLDTLKESPEYEAQEGLRLHYSRACHFAHFDITGVTTRFDISQISEQNLLEIEELEYGLRIISNLLSCTIFRTAEAARAIPSQKDNLRNVFQTVYTFSEEVTKFANSTRTPRGD